MKRVLVTGAANIGKAGVATIVYKWGQSFPQEKIVYDYLMQSGFPDEIYQNEIKKIGGKMYTRSKGNKGIIGVINWIKQIISDNSYNTLHINSDSAYIAAAYIYAARQSGVKNIYVHSHCTQIDDINWIKRKIKTFLHIICKPYVCKYSKMYLACSRKAGIWMFGKKNVNSSKYQTIYNGVEIDRYLFDTSIREEYRRELKVDDKWLISNIGRLSYQKNQDFLLDVFNVVHQKNPNSLLVLVGDGELKDYLKEKVQKLNLDSCVKFLGLRNDIPNLLSAFDVLVMPSRFEGLPVTMVEAQVASLPCVVSSAITDEAKFTSQVHYVDDWDVHKWANIIIETLLQIRLDNSNEVSESLFNINRAAKALAEILISE